VPAWVPEQRHRPVDHREPVAERPDVNSPQKEQRHDSVGALWSPNRREAIRRQHRAGQDRPKDDPFSASASRVWSRAAKALDLITAAGLPRRLMVDASHDNSGKDHRRQPVVTKAIAEQLTARERGLTGVMLESFLAEGKQQPGPPETLSYGQSVTDACMDFGTTTGVLTELAAAVRSRRSF
jgi:hypothetical protein